MSCEDYRTCGRVQGEELVTPRGQHAHLEPPALCLLDDPVNVPEVGLVWLRRIEVDERHFAVGVGCAQTIVLREDHGLDDGESLG